MYMINIHFAFRHSQRCPLAFSFLTMTSLSLSLCLFVCLFSSVCRSLSFPLSPRPPVGWMVWSLARCSSWCPRRSLTWGEHCRRVKLTFYFITHIETQPAAAILNVIQRVNTAQPGGNNKNINSTITAQDDHTNFHPVYLKFSMYFWL